MALVTPFDSIEHLAADLYPIFPIRLLLQDKYDSVGRVGAITAESLVLLAEQDRVVPRAYSENLIAGFASTKLEVQVIEGASHNSISSYESYFSALDLFFNR